MTGKGNGKMMETPKETSIVCYKILGGNREGVTLKRKGGTVFINFLECAENYAREHSLKESKCVADRDAAQGTFTFFTNPKVKVVFPKGILAWLFTGKSAYRQFCSLQNLILTCGFTSYDRS